MSGRILVADDSVTIQKVIEMTLSSEDYGLDSCLNEDELFEKLNSGSYDLIVMDFNLSPKRTGVEIAEKIYQMSPQTPVMAMMGTFDSIDEDSWEKTRISEKIVKPFNSREFVKKCSDLLGNNKKEEDDNDYWSIGGGAPDHRELHEESGEAPVASDDFSMDGDILQQEVLDWGVGLPEVIGGDEMGTAMESLPGIIEKEENEPIDGDRLRDIVQSNERETGEKKAESDPNIDIDEFWKVDGADTDEGAENQNIDIDKKETTRHLADEATIEQIQKSLKPELEEIVKKYCSQKVEEVVWEIIPDLAENLIRSEIKEISNRLTGK